MSGSQETEKFAVVDGDGQPMWQFAESIEHANDLLRLMEARYPTDGPWTIITTDKLEKITGIDGDRLWVAPHFWN